MDAEKENTHPERRPEGKEGPGSHQEGQHSVQAGHPWRREHSEPEQSKPNSINDHQKTVSGKKQHGPGTRSVRTLVGMKAVRDRMWIRVVLLGLGKSLATSATSAAEVAERVAAHHFTLVN